MPPESPGDESTCLIAAQAALPRLQPPASPTCCKSTPIVDMLQQQSQLAGQLLLPCTQSSLAAITEHRAQHHATYNQEQTNNPQQTKETNQQPTKNNTTQPQTPTKQTKTNQTNQPTNNK
ncbi:hypothetical protein Bbelb_209980 [Branchiostoma belcheri]|nr:hypothetical protein Bbelb_209980 [Branchiostoma belcheri]